MSLRPILDPPPTAAEELVLALACVLTRGQPLARRVDMVCDVGRLLEQWTEATPLGSEPEAIMRALRLWEHRARWMLGS